MNKYQELQKQVKSKLQTLEQYRKSGKITEADYQAKKLRIEEKVKEIKERLKSENASDSNLSDIDNFKGFERETEPVQKRDFISLLSKRLLIFLGVFIFLFTITAIMYGLKDDTSIDHSQINQIPLRRYTTKQGAIDRLAQLYLDNHKDKTLTVVQNEAHRYESGALTLDKSMLIIGHLFDTGSSDDDLDAIANSKIYRNMTAYQVLYSWGNPNGYSDYTSSLSSSMQFTYGDVLDGRVNYVYLIDGKVTSWSSVAY